MNCSAGHFHPPVSRRTTAIVEMHLMAKAKKMSCMPAVRPMHGSFFTGIWQEIRLSTD